MFLHQPIFGLGGDVKRQLAAATVTANAGTREDTTDDTTNTIAALAVGDPHPARRIVLCLGLGSAEAGNTGPVTSVTADGVAMTELVEAKATNNAVTAIYEIAQGLLPDSSVTDVDFFITLANGATTWHAQAFTVLSYDSSAQVQNYAGLDTGTPALESETPTLSIEANSCAVSVFAHTGTGGDGMSDPEHVFTNEITTQTRSDGGGVTRAEFGADNFTAADASFIQQHTFTTTVASGQSACTAVWKRF